MIIEKETLVFLKELSDNNNKEWFHSNKDKYNTAYQNILDITNVLLSDIEKFDKSVVGMSAKECIFRIYKDTRFSKDKNPYKTNFGIFFKKGKLNTPGSGYYLHIEPNGMSMIGIGIYMPPTPILNKIRLAIIKDSSEIKEILNSQKIKETFGGLQGEKVKTAPKGFSKDHPDIELLKFKHFTLMKMISDPEVLNKDFIPICISSYKIGYEFHSWINKILQA